MKDEEEVWRGRCSSTTRVSYKGLKKGFGPKAILTNYTTSSLNN